MQTRLSEKKTIKMEKLLTKFVLNYNFSTTHHIMAIDEYYNVAYMFSLSTQLDMFSNQILSGHACMIHSTDIFNIVLRTHRSQV